MLKAIAIKALLGIGALGVVGGSAAIAGSPALTANLLAATTAKAGSSAAAAARHHARGTIIKLSSTQMTVERHRRDPSTKALATEDVTVGLNDKTVVHYLGSKDKHGIDVLKLGQEVGVRFEGINEKKVARGVVILPDHRAGRIVSKDADGRSFTIRTRQGSLVKVTTGAETRFVAGTRKDHKTGSYADLKVGDRVLALGQEDSHHVFDAAVVRSMHVDPHAGRATTPKV